MSLAELISFSVLCSLYLIDVIGCILTMRNMRLHPSLVLNADHVLPQGDFTFFWYAGHLLYMKSAAWWGFHPDVSPWIKATFQINILNPSSPIQMAWPYPPMMGLLLMPFSCIPLRTSFWIWRLFSLVVSGYLLRKAGLRWSIILMGLASPAAWQDMVGGQNGTLTGSILVAALLWMSRNQRIAGILAGILCIKPQIALALPVILLNLKRLTALRWSLITVIGLIGLSILIEGWYPWWFFFHTGHADAIQQSDLSFTQFFPTAGITVFYMMRSFGVDVAAAWDIQIISALLALTLVWRVWSYEKVDPIWRMSITCCLLVLILPHGFAYDLVPFSIAMAVLYQTNSGITRFNAGLLWLLCDYSLGIANYTNRLLFPLVAIAGIILLMRQHRDDHQRFEALLSVLPVSLKGGAQRL